MDDKTKKYVVDPHEGDKIFVLPNDYTPEDFRSAAKAIYEAYDKKEPLVITDRIKVFNKADLVKEENKPTEPVPAPVIAPTPTAPVVEKPVEEPKKEEAPKVESPKVEVPVTPEPVKTETTSSG